MSVVTCHTEGCGNAEWPIEMQLLVTDPDTGEPHYVRDVFCGVCGQQITDIQPPVPEVDPKGGTT